MMRLKKSCQGVDYSMKVNIMGAKTPQVNGMC